MVTLAYIHNIDNQASSMNIDTFTSVNFAVSKWSRSNYQNNFLHKIILHALVLSICVGWPTYLAVSEFFPKCANI